MLRLDLSEILRTVGMHQRYEIDEAPYEDEDVEFVSPLIGSVTVTNAGRLLLVRGAFDTTLELECARCLVEVRQPIRAEIEEQYSLAEVETAHYHDVIPMVVQDEENELPEGLFDGPVMNLGLLIRQAAILTAPWSILCREDCQGLCPTCGKNNNKGACTCAPDGTYRPFAALPELFRQEPNR
ncbi:MAG: DUF177 domain-containing protein [Capsulimonadaceae bacterium]|nr:DUF177 domain-containing protein [Capsulimonadaceae bacterium]